MKSGSFPKVIRQCPEGYLRSTHQDMRCFPHKCLPRRWKARPSQLPSNRKKDMLFPPARSISAVRVLKSRRPSWSAAVLFGVRRLVAAFVYLPGPGRFANTLVHRSKNGDKSPHSRFWLHHKFSPARKSDFPSPRVYQSKFTNSKQKRSRGMKKFFAIMIAAAAFTFGGSAAFAQMMKDNPMVGGAAMYASKTIAANAVNSADHTTLVAAVKAAGLVDTLNGKGPFTVFAPTNDAFAQLPAGAVDMLLKPENKAMLAKVLTYHVVSGNWDSKP